MGKLRHFISIKPIISSVFALFILGSLVVVPVNTSLAATAATTINITPALQTVAQGSTITFEVGINTTTPTLGWQADLDYDANAMTFVSMSEGTFLTGSGATTDFTKGNLTYGVGKVNIIDGGSGYSNPLTVTFTGGGVADGNEATATAQETGGVINSITVTYGGLGYTSAPTVTISGGTGSGAVLSPNMTSIIQAFADAQLGGAGVTGSGTLCTITMTAKNVNELTDLTLANVLASTVNKQDAEIPITGISVGSGQVIIGSPQPTITGFTPTSAGAGATITINGTNLNDATQVTTGGVAASVVTDTSTQIIAIVGNAASGSVAMTNALGTATLAGFTFIALPGISSFTPTTGGSGTLVEISGTNFTGVTAVSFGATAAASYTVNSANQITAVVGSGTTGSVSVTTGSGVATLAGFTYTATPSISSFSPTIAPAGQSVTIIGDNFTGVTAVTFGGTSAASFAVNTSNQITAVVGSGSSGTVAVTTANGTAMRPDLFLHNLRQ